MHSDPGGTCPGRPAVGSGLCDPWRLTVAMPAAPRAGRSLTGHRVAALQRDDLTAPALDLDVSDPITIPNQPGDGGRHPWNRIFRLRMGRSDCGPMGRVGDMGSSAHRRSDIVAGYSDRMKLTFEVPLAWSLSGWSGSRGIGSGGQWLEIGGHGRRRGKPQSLYTVSLARRINVTRRLRSSVTGTPSMGAVSAYPETLRN